MQMPVTHVRLQCQHHPCFEFLMAIRYDVWLLLMPPGAHAMANQGDPVVVAMGTKLLHGKGVNGTGFDANLACLKGLPVDIAHDGIRLPLCLRWGAQHNGT